MELFEAGRALVNNAGHSDGGYFIIVGSSLLGVILFVTYMMTGKEARFFASALIFLVPSLLAMVTGVGVVLTQDKSEAGDASQWIVEAEAELIETYDVESVVIGTDKSAVSVVSDILTCGQDFHCPDASVTFEDSSPDRAFRYKVAFADNKHNLELIRVDPLVPFPADFLRDA